MTLNREELTEEQRRVFASVPDEYHMPEDLRLLWRGVEDGTIVPVPKGTLVRLSNAIVALGQAIVDQSEVITAVARADLDASQRAFAKVAASVLKAQNLSIEAQTLTALMIDEARKDKGL